MEGPYLRGVGPQGPETTRVVGEVNNRSQLSFITEMILQYKTMWVCSENFEMCNGKH